MWMVNLFACGLSTAMNSTPGRGLGERCRRAHSSVTGPVLDAEWLAEPLA
jgi:hypothetical protein